MTKLLGIVVVVASLAGCTDSPTSPSAQHGRELISPRELQPEDLLQVVILSPIVTEIEGTGGGEPTPPPPPPPPPDPNPNPPPPIGARR